MTLKEYGITKNGILCNDTIICECGAVLNKDIIECPHCHNDLAIRNLKKVKKDKIFGEKIYMEKKGDDYHFAHENLIVIKEGDTYRLDHPVKYYMNITKKSVEFNTLKGRKILTLVEKELPGFVVALRYLSYTKQKQKSDYSYLAKLYFKIRPLFINKSFQDLERLNIINPDHGINVEILSFLDTFSHIDFNDKEQWPIDMNYIGIITHFFIYLNNYKKYEWNDFLKKIQQHSHKEILLRILEHLIHSNIYPYKFIPFIEQILNQEMDDSFYQCFLKCCLDGRDDVNCLIDFINDSNDYKINISWLEITNFNGAYRKLQLLIKEKENPTNTKKILDAYSLVDKNPLKALELLASISSD